MVKQFKLARQWGDSSKTHTIQMYYCARTRIAAATKKTTIGDRHCTYNLIVRAVTIAGFTIDQPALLENNRKIATMGGGGDYHCVKKLASLCLSSVCFYRCFRSYEKLGLLQKKTN